MLSDAQAVPTLAVKDIGAAKKFYSETLGLAQLKESPGGVTYSVGSGAIFVYPSQFAGTNKATACSFTVKDVRATVDGLKAKGVTFKQYDGMPGVTRDGDIHTMDGGRFEAAWCEDPDGNILAFDNGEE